LNFSAVVRSGNLHPSQKPTDLLSYLIKTYTQPGETVLDFTMGSGSTGVSCAETGRAFIGIEKPPEDERETNYFPIAQERIEKAYRRAAGQARQGKPADFANLPMFAEVVS
jgi:DNA modification methylase